MTRTYTPRTPDALFLPAQIGDISVKNRIVMSPMTRARAGDGLEPVALNAEYYAQRASAGLIITEATQVSVEAQGYIDTPGLFTPGQVQGWKTVTGAVHAAGGKIVVQLWHTGRMSHTTFQPGGRAPGAPSAIRANAKVFVEGEGFIDTSTPRPLELSELPQIIDDFRSTCAKALEAGFDGVEIHGAHGYLLDSFLRDGANHRTDAYGGPIENRARLLLEVTEACAKEIGGGRLGIRLSPVSPAGDSHDSAPQPLFEHIVERLNPMKLAFIDIVEGATGGPRDNAPFDYEALHDRFDGAWMVNNGYTRRMALDAVASGKADFVAFGRPFIANPDLVRRLREDLPLAELDPATTYGKGAAGYTTYPALD
ncbi:MAG TPA: alkene reductase [Alphaproteobacteria bacterium]|nr:alkene reductase [Alphaproteobacteria bacterium]